jgi:hypothetical protein
MKLKVLSALTVIGMFFGNLSVATAADIPYEVPKVVSFTVSQKQIDVNTANAKLTFTLTVSHPVGIRSTKTSLWFKSKDGRISVSTNLVKQSAAAGAKEFKFVGDLSLDPSFPPGLYDFYAESIEGEPGSRGMTVPTTSTIYPQPFNDFLDGETSVVVRSMGKLNLSTKTFVGPSHTSSIYLTDDKPAIYGSAVPIFRIGEIYDPTKYFLVRAPGIKLKIETTTPTVCIKDGDNMKFIAIGSCSYRVYTDANNDYLSTTITLSSDISPARSKPTISVPTVATQDVKNLPKRVETYLVYNTAGFIIQPVTTTPDVCFASFQFITIVGGGKCILNYQSAATNDHLASDLYQLSFDVTKDPQTVTFKPTATVDVATKTLDLSATATSGGNVTFSSNSKEICTVEGSKATLLKSGNCEIVATQVGTPLIAAASAAATIQIIGKVAKTRTIRCVKGNKTERITGVKPKCPKGFKKA